MSASLAYTCTHEAPRRGRGRPANYGAINRDYAKRMRGWGWTYQEIANALGCSAPGAYLAVNPDRQTYIRRQARA